MITKYRLQNIFFKSIFFKAIPKNIKEKIKKVLIYISVRDTNEDRVKNNENNN